MGRPFPFPGFPGFSGFRGHGLMAPEDLQVHSPQEAAEVLATPPAPTEDADDGQDTKVLATPPTETPGIGGREDRPRLADGIDLIGEFEDSGFKQAPFIARRSDGQVVQMPDLLYRLAEQVDGQANLEQIAERFSHAIERNVEAGDVQMLIDEQLRPLGIVAQPIGAQDVELNKVDPLLSLKLRTAVVPDRVVRALTTVFRPLFLPPVILLVVLGILGVDGWLFFVHGHHPGPSPHALPAGVDADADRRRDPGDRLSRDRTRHRLPLRRR